MRKVIKGKVETGLVSLFLSLSLYHSSNNPCYLSSHVLSVGIGCLCAGRQSLGDSSLSLGDSLMAVHRRETFYHRSSSHLPSPPIIVSTHLVILMLPLRWVRTNSAFLDIPFSSMALHSCGVLSSKPLLPIPLVPPNLLLQVHVAESFNRCKICSPSLDFSALNPTGFTPTLRRASALQRTRLKWA